METEENKLWTENVKSIQDDSILLSLVKTHGTKKWALISRILKEQHNISEKSGKQCRERWINILNPKLSAEPWTAQEEKILFENQEKYGNKWSTIASFLKGRSDNATKNHFYSIVRKNIRRYNKHKPPNQRIEGNIQDLLSKPELRKIIVKKPRHYHGRTEKKSKTEVSAQNSPKTSTSPVRRKSRTSNPASTELINAKYNAATFLPETQTIVQKVPKNFVCPTPVHQLYIEDFAPTPLNKGPNSYSTRETLSIGDESVRNFELFDDTPQNDGKHFVFYRNYGRNLSFKSNDDEFLGRGDSRKSTEKSEGIRGESRKNSQKEIWERNGIRSDSRKNSGKEQWERTDSRQNTFYAFPLFSPKRSFDYNKTPKNTRN